MTNNNDREQLTKVVDELKITATSVYGAVEVPEGWDRGTHPYKVTLRYGRRSLTLPFFQGSAHTSEPTAADVLACISSDAQVGDQTFEEFCSDFGYDQDNRKAEKTYKACVALAPRLHKFLGDAFDRVCRAEH